MDESDVVMSESEHTQNASVRSMRHFDEKYFPKRTDCIAKCLRGEWPDCTVDCIFPCLLIDKEIGPRV